MVTEYTKVISYFVHDVYKVFSPADCSDDIALDSITSINKKNVVAFCNHCILVSNKACVPDILIDSAMDIVCIKNNNFFLCFKCFSCTLCKYHCDAENHNERNKGNSLKSVHISSVSIRRKKSPWTGILNNYNSQILKLAKQFSVIFSLFLYHRKFPTPEHGE